MILVDKDIKILGASLIIENYDEKNIGAVSYDLTANIYFKEKEEDSYKEYILKPKEIIIVKTKEKIKIPNNLLGIIDEKNSLLRMGLQVKGPRYHPGHETYIYLRLYNLSEKEIILKEGLNIAQIFFETLTNIPEKCYGDREKDSYQNEEIYIKYGKYEEEYKKL